MDFCKIVFLTPGELVYVLSREVTLSKYFVASKKRSTLNGKSLLPVGKSLLPVEANSFLLESAQERKEEVTMSFLFFFFFFFFFFFGSPK